MIAKPPTEYGALAWDIHSSPKQKFYSEPVSRLKLAFLFYSYLINIHFINLNMDVLLIEYGIAEITAKEFVITDIEDGVDLVGNVYYQGFDKVIIYEQNITPQFFDLSTKIAGEILQKFSNYRIKLAIVGAFETYQSKSMKDFIFESNKLGQINFVNSKAEAINVLSK
ncbi:hypothetical protein D3C87_429220 [compost metagenome]